MKSILDMFGLLEAKDLILLALGALVGYLLSLIATKQTEKKKDLVLEVLGRHIVAESTDTCPFLITDLAGMKLDNVYYFVVRVWNRGREAVRGDEISRTAPLSIEVSEDANVIGEPQIMKPHPEMEFSITSLHQNKFSISFDCLNHDEWVEVGFYMTGNPRATISGAGRVFGQHSEFDVTTDDSRTGWLERLSYLLVVLMIVSSPFALPWALWWAYTEYTISDLLFNTDKLPKFLMTLFCLGIIVPTITAYYFSSLWFKRKNNPKGYPIREDFEPTQRESLRAFYLTALRGKRYEVSASVHDYGEIKTRSIENNKSDLP
ncbi:hypothetical protein IAI51_07160 [Pseudomonas sp. N40(2020)]|uniref:hypothetical protein n=1 Tax=Pseudomonas sp. N40(2020) TaxID=2767798 RepID=UPI0016569A19|nr:hypothetical protein [Pseudomonas sp. N40(2020)]MBC8996307.1 hypothetical protein [Pseudomonas sp. N40(2020)]